MASSIMQLLQEPALRNGSIRFDGIDLTSLSPGEMRTLRGKRIALIPQAAMNALNPVMNVRSQLAEAVTAHHAMDKQRLHERWIRCWSRSD